MYKQLTACFMVITLGTASTVALADRKHHRDYRYHQSHKYDTRYHHKRWQPPVHRVTHIHQHYRKDYAGYLGAALLGSAITYTLFHQHNGAVCHDSHGHRDSHDYRDRYSSRYDVVGCHRIERFADGSERRVSVPLAQCY